MVVCAVHRPAKIAPEMPKAWGTLIQVHFVLLWQRSEHR